MFNIISSYYPGAGRRIMLCAHWDSRPVSDMDPDSSKTRLPIPGANDGASGVAVLLELGRLIRDHQPPVGVDIVLFDGEDYGSDEWPGGWFLGSKYFMENAGGYRPRLALLVDMIGDADLQIYREGLSQKFAPDLNDYIWAIAAEVGSEAFVDAVGDTVSDDHISLLSKGVKSIDIIDFDYPYWHTQEDTPDKCSAESLGEVGRVLTAAIYDRRIEDF
jgi:Zn-dependent M28 family amino/carboxypeptidase